MKRTLNTIFHGLGAMLICVGFILFIGAGGTCDCGGDMELVARVGLSGIAMFAVGAFLTWWKI